MAARQRQRTITPRTAKVVTTGTIVRLEPPKSRRKPKPKASDVAVVVAQEINPVSGFLNFLREYAIVSLAVGFALASQVQALVKQLIASFIDPLYALLFSGKKLSAMDFTLHWHGRVQDFAWGGVVYALIDLIFVLGVIYLLVKLFGLDRLQKPADKK